MTNIVLDLETLDTKPGATVIAIGAWEVESGRHFYHSVVGDKGTESQDTLEFWCRPDLQEARLMLKENPLPVVDALQAFTRWLPEYCWVWGNGSGFDNVILRECYRRNHMEAPWGFRVDRDLRTLRGLFPLESEPAFEGIPHYALHDARHEARLIQEICEEYSIFLEAMA